MSILATTFVNFFNFQCSVCWSKSSFTALFHLRKIAKAKKQTFFDLNNCHKFFQLFAFLIFFAVEPGIVLNIFLNFEQK